MAKFEQGAHICSYSLHSQTNMAKDIHPKYYPKTKVSCSCGNKFEVGSTKENMEIEVCSACHSFYTGKEKMIDAMGQVQKFQKRLSRKQDLKKK